VTLAARFDASDEWIHAGSPTAAHWIADALDICVSTAREWIRVGKALLCLPVMSKTFAENEISYSKVRALTRLATAENESELCAIAKRVPAGRLGHALAAWTAQHESDSEREARHQRDRRHSWQTEADGMVAGFWRLPPAEAGRLAAALDAHLTAGGRQSQSPSTTPRDIANTRSGVGASAGASLAQQRADALVALVDEGGAEVVTELVIHVRGDGSTLDDGTPVPGTVVERLAPDAFIRALICDAEGSPINASGRQRHPTARQRRVARARDGGCVDCGANHLIQYDHVPAYEITRNTLVDELECRCAPCHRARHRREAS